MTRPVPSALPEPIVGIESAAIHGTKPDPASGTGRRPIATAVGSNLGVAVAAMLGVLLIAILAASPARAASAHVGVARIVEPAVAPRIADIAPWIAGPGMVVAAVVLVFGIGALLLANVRSSRSR